MPWLTTLVQNVETHIQDVHHQTWHHILMERGSYFYPTHLPPMPNHRFPSCHFFITNYSERIHIFHCAAKLEDGHQGIPHGIVQLFENNNVQPGAFGGGREIGWAEIIHPSQFDVANEHHQLPEQLWIDILARLLLQPTLRNFINAWAP